MGLLLTGAVPAVIQDRDKKVTYSVEWPEYCAYPMALGAPLTCKVYINVLTRTLYSLTDLVKLLEDSVTYLDMHFYKYPPPPQNEARWRACVIGAFRKFVLVEAPWGYTAIK